jgi:CheY-like chemotaxis protein
MYDSFVLSEDGELHEVILREFLDLNVRSVPGVTHASSADQAVDLARDPRHNLIIASAYLGDVPVVSLARRLREAGIETPIAALAYDTREAAEVLASGRDVSIERTFLWQGDVRLLPAIVKELEDRRNAEHDIGALGVQAILVVEDDVRFYSSFLPTIYGELMQQAHRLLPDGVNLSHKLLRLQAQPKVLLCGSYEEAWDLFERYEQNVLGVISDVEFPRRGVVDPDAGLELARTVRGRQPDVPVMLQSSRAEKQPLARAIGASFLLKGAPTLLHQLQRFMIDQLGFGEFVFRLPNGREVARAADLRELEQALTTIPAESVAYHAERNHFSRWFKARTEFALAHELRPRKLGDFASIEGLRAEILRALRDHRDRTRRGVAVDFDAPSFSARTPLTRIGGGALGGKARGLAFVDLLLGESRLAERFPGVSIVVPPAVVIGTDVFDAFVDQQHLREFALDAVDDREIERRFLRAELPDPITADLTAFLASIQYPIAVRSSSLLEDSQYHPFAGIYDTFMLSNDHPRLDVRLRQMLTAVKRVYASTFSAAAKRYFAGGAYRLEEEKMAVVLQRVVGAPHDRRFYPDLAGVARSYNYYPILPMRADDGIVAAALGLGETVVSGEPCFRFCPRYPRHVVQLSTVTDALNNTQRAFRALVLGGDSSLDSRPARFDLAAAEADGTLWRLGSTYSPENYAVFDGVSRPGVRLVTFASILKHDAFPLASIVDALLGIAVDGTSSAVELEFAVSFPNAGPPEFGIVQLRPLARVRGGANVELGDVSRDRLICESANVLGHGVIAGVRDVLVVDVHRFDRRRTRQIADQVAQLNAELVSGRRPYLLIGVGRWGSADPFLGIPVTWDQIAGARAIVEAGIADFRVTPSQGSHFFQNLAAGNIGYFTVNPDAGEGFVDWAWLAAQPAIAETAFVRHLRFDEPLSIAVDGRSHAGTIRKPR